MKLPLGTSIFSVQHFTFLNAQKVMIEIKAHELIDGVVDIKDSIVAYPFGAIGSFGNKECLLTLFSQRGVSSVLFTPLCEVCYGKR